MVSQSNSLVSFILGDADKEEIFSSLEEKPNFTNCSLLNQEQIEWIFYSIRDENPGLLGRKDRPVFPTGRELKEFSGNIHSSIQESNEEKGVWFFIWKEEDDLNPFTRIRRTSFYLFCDNDKINIIFGEWKRNIVFQNQYNFSDWITAERFNIQQTKDRRFFIYEPSRDKMDFFRIRKNNETLEYSDWIVYFFRESDKNTYESSFEKNNSTKSGQTRISNENNNDSSIKKIPKDLPERLKILDDLKKRGLITEEEYKNKRKELLDSL